MHTLLLLVGYVLVTIGVGFVAGVVFALTTYFRVRTMNVLNKKLGGRSYVLLTGSPEAVRQAYEVCIAVIGQVEAKQQRKTDEGIALNDQPSTPAEEAPQGPIQPE